MSNIYNRYHDSPYCSFDFNTRYYTRIEIEILLPKRFVNQSEYINNAHVYETILPAVSSHHGKQQPNANNLTYQYATPFSQAGSIYPVDTEASVQSITK